MGQEGRIQDDKLMLFSKKKDTNKDRPGFELLANVGGHRWYKLMDFKENITERYLNYVKIVSQYDQLRLTLADIRAFCDKAIMLSKDGKTKELHTLLEVLNSYTLLEENNDITFNIAVQFLFIDDEPEDKISAEHYELKRKLYNEQPSVKVFFCEVSRILRQQPVELRSNWEMMDILNDKGNQLTEETFSRLTRAAT